MNNIVLLLIDSMNNSHIKDSSIELTPFLNTLKNKGVFCESMYSQAPYTEAANMGIYCGTDVLDNGGYIFRYKDAPLTIFEAMKQKGYETYYNDFQPQCHLSSVRRGIDHIYYSVGYDLGALWSYRLVHYSGLLKEDKLNESDFDTLKEIFKDNFQGWIQFTEDILKKDKSVNMICDNDKTYDAAEVKKLVEKEFNTYLLNPTDYIIDVLKCGTSHRLFSIPAFVQNYKIKNRTVMDYVRKEYKPLLKRIRSMGRKLNSRNCKGIFKGPCKQTINFIKKPCRENLKNVAKSALLSLNQLYDLDLFERIGENYDLFKNSPSLKTHVDHYLDWRKNTSSSQPHFAFMHVDDIHNPEVFFTYDTEDVSILAAEKEHAIQLLDQIPPTYQGSLSHDLSLRYIDSAIEYFFKKMELYSYLDDTTIVICADHGFSFSGNPLRDSVITNLFLENYNIPFIVCGPKINHKEIIGLRQSKDIPATLCDLADGKIPLEFTGHSVFENSVYDSLLIEYCGGGCPDLSRREIKMASFNEQWFIGSLATLKEPVTKFNITEVYNLIDDPTQTKNLVKEIDYCKIQELVEKINERKKRIMQSLNV